MQKNPEATEDAHFLNRLFFVPKLASAAEPTFRVAVTLAILLFLATRFSVLAIFAARDYHILGSDSGNYIAIADFIRENGRLPNTDTTSSRQYPGLALLMAAVTPIFGSTVVAGYFVSGLAAIGSLILFHALFRNFRLTLLYVVFVPSWVASSSLIMSEGPTFLLMLTAIWALHRESLLPRRLFFLFVAGFIMVVRNTAAIFLIPFIVAWWWEQERKQYGWNRLFAYALATAALPLVYLSWNWFTLGELYPQLRAQHAFITANAQGGFPERALTWPGQALIHALGINGIPLAKKLSVVCSLSLGIAVTLRYFFRSTGTVTRDLARPFAYASFLHLAFHLCIGGSFGFSSIDRYVSHINPVLAKGVAGERQIRWFWLILATLVGILFAGLTGHSNTALIPFLKPD